MANFATRQQVKDFLGISASTDDAQIDALLERTSRMIANYTNRELLEATYTDEQYDGDGHERDIVLKQYPVSTLTTVKWILDRVNSTTETLTELLDYILRQKNDTKNPGIVRLLAGVWPQGSDNILITYTAGYASASIPADLVQAQIDWVSYILGNKESRIGISSYRLGQFSINYKDNTLRDNNGSVIGTALPPDEVRLVLDFYKDYNMESTFQ